MTKYQSPATVSANIANPYPKQMKSPQMTAAKEAAPKIPANGNLTIAIYLVVTGLSAACGLIIEIVAGRMIAPYLGMSLYTWTAVIAVVLAGFSVGHWIGGWLAEKPSGPARRAVVVSLALAGVSAALSLVLLRALSGPVIAIGLPAVPTILLLTFLLFFLPSLFVGIPSPVLTKLAIDEAPSRMGTLLGAFYAIGALGSIAGTLAAGYVFISYFGSIRTILTVALLYAAMATIVFELDRRLEKQSLLSKHVVLPLAAIALLFGGVFLWGRSVSAFVENCTKESAYYCIRVIDISRDVGTPARTMVLDHLGHGTNLRDRPEIFLTPYVEAQDALVKAHFKDRPDPSAFFIGGGAYTLPRAWLTQWPAAKVTVSEIDPAVTKLARDSFWLPDDPRLKLRHQDARRALASEPQKSFDVIIGDAFHDIAVPQHLVTREFFELIASRLKDDGTYLMNVVDSGSRPSLTLSIRRTLQDVFPIVELWQPFGQGARQTFVILAANSPTPKKTLYSRTDPESSWHLMTENEIAKLESTSAPLLLTDDFAPVDRLIGAE